jgi:AbrB family looped-hinge helix DNA binding protein
MNKDSFPARSRSAEVRTRVDQKGRIALPAAFRKELGITSGDPLVMRIVDGELCVLTLKRRIEMAQERVRKYVKPGFSLADELIADRRLEVLRERD